MSGAWDPGHLQTLAWWLSLAMLVSVLLILTGLLGLRLYRRWQAPKVQALRQAHRLLLMQCVAGEPVQGRIILRDRGERWVFLKSWLHMQLSLKGAASTRLTEMGRELGLHDLALSQLRSSHYAKRMVALLTLGFLRLPSSVPLLQQRLTQGHSHTAIYAGRALLEIDPRVHAAEVVQGLLGKGELDLALAAVMFKPFRPSLQEAMLSQWPRLDPSDMVRTTPEQLGPMVRWLRLARALQLQLPSPLLVPLLHPQEDIESLIAAIRLFQGEQGIEPLLRLAHHPDWRVRAQVARALAYVGQPATLPLLVELTTDREWWVRFRSAQALFRLPGVTAKLILEKVQATQDRYAIQMVESVAMTLGGA